MRFSAGSADSRSLGDLAARRDRGDAADAHPSSGADAFPGAGVSASPPHESLDERDDRNLAELLQELRIGGLGVQVLFGFLLAVPFDSRFSKLDSAQRSIYVATVLLAALAVVLLVAPVAYHRMLFRRGLKEPLVIVANVMAIGGLGVVALAMTAAIWLVCSVVVRGPIVPVLVVAAGAAFGSMWFLLPARARMTWHRSDAATRDSVRGRPGP